MDEELTADELIAKFENREPKYISEEETSNEPVEPPEGEEPEGDDQQEDQPEPEADTDTEEVGEDEGEETSDEPSGDAELELEVKVGDQTHKVKASDLTRLYGQEAALTQRSQAVAEQNRLIEAQGLYLAKLYDGRITAAKANADKYAKVDLWEANRKLEPDEFDTLRSAKEAAEAELAAVEAEALDFMKHVHETKQSFLRNQAKEAVVKIRQEIPDWSDDLYSQIRGYAVSQGMDTQSVNEIVDPSAIVMMRKAMLYDQIEKKSETVTKKAAKAPTKVSGKTEATTGTNQTQKALINKARSTGDIDDVVAAFMAKHSS